MFFFTVEYLIAFLIFDCAISLTNVFYVQINFYGELFHHLLHRPPPFRVSDFPYINPVHFITKKLIILLFSSFDICKSVSNLTSLAEVAIPMRSAYYMIFNVLLKNIYPWPTTPRSGLLSTAFIYTSLFCFRRIRLIMSSHEIATNLLLEPSAEDRQMEETPASHGPESEQEKMDTEESQKKEVLIGMAPLWPKQVRLIWVQFKILYILTNILFLCLACISPSDVQTCSLLNFVHYRTSLHSSFRSVGLKHRSKPVRFAHPPPSDVLFIPFTHDFYYHKYTKSVKKYQRLYKCSACLAPSDVQFSTSVISSLVNVTKYQRLNLCSARLAPSDVQFSTLTIIFLVIVCRDLRTKCFVLSYNFFPSPQMWEMVVRVKLAFFL